VIIMTEENDANLMQPGRAYVPTGSNVEQVRDGGAGSGNFGHAGRPGEVGGSGPGGGGSTKPNYNPKETSHRYGVAASNAPTSHEGDFVDFDGNYIPEHKVESGYSYSHREFGGLPHTKYGGYKSIDRAKNEAKDLLKRHASVVIRQGKPYNNGSNEEPDWEPGHHEVWVSDK